jgi:hypothetical protein
MPVESNSGENAEWYREALTLKLTLQTQPRRVVSQNFPSEQKPKKKQCLDMNYRCECNETLIFKRGSVSQIIEYINRFLKY